MPDCMVRFYQITAKLIVWFLPILCKMSKMKSKMYITENNFGALFISLQNIFIFLTALPLIPQQFLIFHSVK